MSYSRNYYETIEVSGSKSVTVDYPASENGGSTTVTVDYREDVPVNVNIHVDTEPFDYSVENCNTKVNLLTGAVVATETAQLASIDKNSRQVANTVISGFFGYIRSEISQQVAELTQNIDAHLMHLKELSQSCLSKKFQMESDYNRISSRYTKTFNDLNSELSNRIHELDKAAFIFKNELDNQKFRATGNDMVTTVSIFGTECGNLQSKISVSIAKKRALDTLNRAKVFLWQQKKLGNAIQKSMLNENLSFSKYSPICFIETQNEKNQIGKNLFITNYLTSLLDHSVKNELIEKFSESTNTWVPASKSYIDDLRLHFIYELNKTYFQSDKHSERVREMIQKILNLNSINQITLKNI